MDLLKRNALDAPAFPKIELDLAVFKDGALVGIRRRVTWLPWPRAKRG